MRPHRFDAVRVAPDGTVSLTLGGGYTPGVGLINRFQPYPDIYPVEVSTNLVDWEPLTWMIRTNSSANVAVFVDSEASGFTRRFYRTPANTFVAPHRVPSGPYPVGVTDRTIRDDSRRNRCRISTNGSFPITIYYPATRLPGSWPTAYALEPWVRDPRIWPRIDMYPYLSRHCLRDAPFAPGLTRLPVVFYSHGWTSSRDDGTEQAEHIASHGYVVVSVDHLDCSYLVNADGTYLFIDPSDLRGRNSDVTLLQDRVRDFVVVLDEMDRWNRDDPLFAGRFDVQNTAAMGWSLGGATAAEFCRADSRCRAAVALDPGGYQAPLTSVGLQKPSLTMHRSDYADYTLFNMAITNAYWFQVRNNDHAIFSTYYWNWNWGTTPLETRRDIARTVTDYTVWFLNKYLRGITDSMPSPTNYPQLFNFKQK